MKKLLLLLVLICAMAESRAQCMAVLDKLSKGSRTRIYSGDFIKIQSKKDSLGNSVRLQGEVLVDCSGILIFPQGDRISVTDIARISIPRGGLLPALEKVAFLGGKLYLGLSAFNGLTNNDSPIIHQSAWPVFIVSEGAYFALKAFNNRWVKLSPGKREVKVLDLRP
jgi:hypothetical protein